jgi:hypothetical protein
MSNVLRFPGVQLPPPPADDHELRADIRRRLAAVVSIMATAPSDDDIARAIYQMRKAMVGIECIRVIRALP